jgi:phospholipase/lecithinase/hemolysin
MVLASLCGPFALPAPAAFSSFYIFGDGVSTTTGNASGYSVYWGNRYCNGRVWVEVLAQRQGLPSNTVTNVNWSYSSNNWSYFGDYSSDLVRNVTSFNAPTNASTALFAVWVNNADFVYDITHYSPYTSNNIAVWNDAIKQSLTNHWMALTNLYYAKGARTLIMPNAVDLTEIPAYVHLAPASKSFIRERITDFNTAYAALLSQATASLPGIKIYAPDLFALLDDILAHPANYGVTNAVYDGQSIDALDDPSLTDLSLDGPGANYIFWDDMDPTARAHAVIADVVQQLISPAEISNLTCHAGSNRLDTAQLPIGLAGFVDGTSNLASENWMPATNFNATSAEQALFVPPSGPQQFYRLRFPFAWSWP